MIDRWHSWRPRKWFLLVIPLLAGVLAIPAPSGGATRIAGSQTYTGKINGTAGTATVTVVNRTGVGSGCKISGVAQTVEVDGPTGGATSTGNGTANITVSVTIGGTAYSFTDYSDSPGRNPTPLAGNVTKCGGQTETVTFTSANSGFVTQSILVTYVGPAS